jgi:hypothetical protein
MADEETSFNVFLGNDKFKVMARDENEAMARAKAFQQEEINARGQTQYEQAPAWAKPFMAAGDVALTASDVFGVPAAMDYAMGTNIQQDVNAARHRMGTAAIPVDMLAASRLPGLGRIPGMLGGGPSARAITRGTTSAVEGTTYGGLQALAHDQPVDEGAALGGAGGVVGSMLGPIVNKGYKAIRGIDDSIPQGIRSKMTALPAGQANPSLVDQVTVAENLARRAARRDKFKDPLTYQTEVKSNIEDIANALPTRGKGAPSPEIQALLAKITDEDPATKLARVGGTVASRSALGVGLAGGYGLNPAAGLAMAGGQSVLGRALKSVSAGGTDEAMRDLRRALAKVPKYEGILTAKQQDRLMKAARQGVLEYPYDE